jgi:hypothetical protein
MAGGFRSVFLGRLMPLHIGVDSVTSGLKVTGQMPLSTIKRFFHNPAKNDAPTQGTCGHGSPCNSQ